MGILRSRDIRSGGLRHLSWLGDVMADAVVDTGDSVGQWWMILHIHTQGEGRQGWDQRDVRHPSMHSGWHARIGAGLGTKGPRGSGVIQGVPWPMMRDGSR